MNDDFLYKFRKPPRREFAAALYKKLSARNGDTTPMKTPSRIRILRAAALAVSAVAVITAVLFFSPSTRAFADNMIRQFGGYIFVQATPEPPSQKDKADKLKLAESENRVKISPEQEATLRAEKMKMADQPSEKPATVQKEPGLTSGSHAADTAAASQLAGFTVIAPAYMPAGYIPAVEKNADGGWSVTRENGSVTAITTYESQTVKSFIAIEELQYEQGQPETVERPQIQDVTVRGQPGAWMPDEGGKSTLAWDENGITYLVVGNTLSLEEALKIAESLGK